MTPKSPLTNRPYLMYAKHTVPVLVRYNIIPPQT